MITKYPLNHGLPTEIGPRSTHTLSYQLPLSELFHPTWLAVPDDVASCLQLEDLRVGKNSQLLTTDTIPMSLFSQGRSETINLEKRGLKMDRIMPGLSFTLVVRNLSDHPVTFTATLIGLVHADVLQKDKMFLDYVLGLGETPIEPGKTAYPQVTTFVPFNPRILYVPVSINAPLVVERLEKGIAGETEYSAVDAGMLDPSTPKSGERQIHLPTQPLKVGQYVHLQVTNPTTEPRVFTGALLGAP